jgi:YbbR domain-containing protein
MPFRDYILNNLGWKLFSLFLAALTWLTIETTFKKEEKQTESLREAPVVNGSDTRSFPTVPVTLLTTATNAGRFKVTPVFVSVEVSGRREDLEKLQLPDIKAFVDVTETDDAKQFSKAIQVQTPKDFRTAAVPPKATIERISNLK